MPKYSEGSLVVDYVEAEGNLPYNTATGTNRLYAAQIIKAWCHVDVTSGPVAGTIEGTNITSVTFPSSDRPRVTFATDMADTNYAVYGSIIHPATFLTVYDQNAGYVELEFWDAANAQILDFATYLKNFSVVILGKQ